MKIMVTYRDPETGQYFYVGLIQYLKFKFKAKTKKL